MLKINTFLKVVRRLSFVVMTLLLHCQMLQAEQFKSASSDSFRYSGRVAIENDKVFLSWPGNSVHFTFTGKQLKLVLDDQTGQNYYNIILNGDDLYPYVLHTKQGRHIYDVSHAIVDDVTSINLFKRTEGQEGGTFFHGVTIADNGQFLDPPDAPKRRILFYGDSITVGMGNEAAHNDPDNKPSDKNHYLSYAAMTARNVNAEFHSIAKSGIGFMVSWFDFIMPQYYDQITAESNNDTSWSFDKWQPDIVVVNLGQNDRWLIENQKKLVATAKDIELAYEAFIRKLMQHHPNAIFICALGSMDATQTNVWPHYIANAVSAIRTSPTNPEDAKRIDALLFEFTGYGAHPRVEQHKKNADTLTDKIVEMTGWTIRERK